MLAVVKPEKKLEALLAAKGRGARARLGRILIESYGMDSGTQLPARWADGIGFGKKNQKIVAHIYGLPTNYFDDDGDEPGSEPAGDEDPSVRYDSLRDFLSELGSIAEDERAWLTSQRFAGDIDIGNAMWWSNQLFGYRMLKQNAEHEPPSPQRPRDPPRSHRRTA